MPGYFALLLLFVILFALSFYFGVREWRHPRDDTPLPIDVEYIRTENYFGVSFRAKMQEWLQTARPIPPVEPWKAPIRGVLEKPNGERILLLTAGSFGGGEQHQELVHCRGDLYLPEGSVFHREIYGLGRVESGAGAQLQALAADGDIVLGIENDVSRWVDARHKVLLRRGTVVHSRVSSLESIELERQVSAQALYAPLIFTSDYRPITESNTTAQQHQNPSAELPGGSSGEESPAWLDGIASSRLSADTWLVRGNLELRPGTHVGDNLVVQGTLRSGPQCSFNANVRADGVELGPGNKIVGNLVSGTVLEIGEAGVVGESVVAERDIVLHAGVRVGAADREAVVSAGRDVTMETNVAVCGKIVAGRVIVTV